MLENKLMLGPLEQKVMEYVWSNKDVSCREIHEHISTIENKEIAYTTILTILDRLFNKGLLSRKKAGKSYIYNYKMSKQQTLKIFAKNMISSLVDRFGDDALGAFADEIENLSKKYKNH